MKTNRKVMVTLLGAGLSLGAAISATFIISPRENLKQTTYIDPVGIATQCYGHTGTDVVPGTTKTVDECIQTLSEDVAKSQQAVHRYIKVPLTFYQEAALISFEYNVGEGNFAGSTLVKKFNAKEYTAGCNELSKWVYAGGEKLPGLVKRREQERQVCLGNLKSIGDLNGD